MNLLDLFIKIKMQDETKPKLTEAEKNTNKLTESFNKMGQGVEKWVNRGLAVGATSIGAFALKSIDLASDLTECQNVIDKTFGSGANQINKFCKEAGQNFGMAEVDAKKFTGTMGAMLKSSGVSADKLADMSSSIVGLSGDFASFYNLGHEEAFDKIKSGISGETEPLKSLGINMSVNNVSVGI